MKKSKLLALGILSACALDSTRAATVGLYEYAFNIDGTISDFFTPGPAPSGVNLGGFDTSTGFGTIQFTISGVGSHNFATFYDHEIDETINTFFNEVGAVSGTAAAGQGWELDDPFFGDIFANFQNNLLANSNDSTSPNDVSLALGWNFNLGALDTAKITLLTSETAPTSGFYLEQIDPDSQASVYLSGSLSITTRAPSTGVPDTSSSFALLALGLTGLSVASRSRRRTAAATI